MTPAIEQVELTSSDSLALTATAATLALFRSKGDAVWPGYDLARRPLLVYLPGRWAILLNAPHDVDGFSPYPDDWPLLGAPVLLHRGPLQGLSGQLEFNLEIDGIKTAAVALTQGLEAGRRAAIGLGFTFIVHEAFHQFQRDTFHSLAGDQPEEWYPVLDSENTALATLEMQVLMDAIRAEARGDTALTRGLAEEFLAIRQERWGRQPTIIPPFERPQEIMEGTAKYVEARCVGLMGDLCKGPVASSDSPPGCDVFAGVTTDRYLLSDFEDRLRDGVIDPVDMARNRAYPIGAALGLLLDFFHVDWKSRVLDAATAPGLAEMLEQGLHRDLARSDSLIREAKTRYRYDDLRARCDERSRTYQAEYQAGVDSLKSEPGFHLSIETPVSGVSRSRSCEGGRLVLGQPTRSFSRKCHVYTLRRLAKDDLFVEIRESAIVEEANAEGTARRVDFVSPDVQSAEIDGRPLALGAPGTYSFTRLRVGGSNFSIRYDGRGTLQVETRQIVARLIPPLAPERR